MSSAIATRIGNSKKERIELDGRVIRKSVDIEKYSHLCLFWFDGEGSRETATVGCCKSRANAEKYNPGWLSRDIYAPKKSDSQEKKDDFHKWMREFKQRYGTPTKKRTSYGAPFYRFSLAHLVRREVITIER